MKWNLIVRTLAALGFLAAAAALVAAQGSVYYFPHVANGETGLNRFCNTLYILNLNNESEDAEITLDFFKDDGSPWMINIYGDRYNGTGSSFTQSLGDGATAYSATNPYNHDLEVGWLRVTSSRPIWVSSTYIFMDWDWNPIWEAGVLPATASRFFAFRAPITPHPLVGDTLNTALAIVNPGSLEALVTLRLYKFGDVVTTKWIPVPALGHVARFLSEIFENYDDVDGESFHVEVDAAFPVAVVGLLSRHNMSVFSSIPLEPTGTLVPNRMADIQGNESEATGRLITPPVEITGNLVANKDYFKVDLLAGQVVNILVVSSQLGSGLDPQLTLFNKFGTQVAYNDDMSTGCKDSFISYTVPSGGRHTIRISYGAGGGFGPFDPYRLIVSVR
ncbi:MAG TPA: PPC domain-containing protein [Acidobacteriota bacterium]|mgnify:CR=1 FL=1|nr:PPC domain-containing protein [Acidobacteriota bacterium]HQF86599.1 PPC domain-containing protein [Acidobacteriota bacterium]HQG90149.1 PPC domain-containing protein [Acidobacteriota bacterium]HQK88742.1 PPC domain-containing protein [Acidobacteriota bacterium]